MSDTLRRQAFNLARITVAYNIAEGIAALAAAWYSGSIALTGFGLDSLVESLSGAVMIWRFSATTIQNKEHEELVEHRARRLVGLTFFVLAAYIVFEAVRSLATREAPEPSPVGIIIALASLIAMPILYSHKMKVGRALGSRSLMADATETLACIYLSAALLTGLILTQLFGFWWADPIAGLIIAAFLVNEGREALGDEDEEAGDDDDNDSKDDEESGESSSHTEPDTRISNRTSQSTPTPDDAGEHL